MSEWTMTAPYQYRARHYQALEPDATDTMRSDEDEVASYTTSGIATNAESGTDSITTPINEDMYRERSKLFDDIANKSLHPSEITLMIQKFEKQKDIPFVRTYLLGQAVP